MRIRNPYTKVIVLSLIAIFANIVGLFSSIYADNMVCVGINCFFLIVSSGNGGYAYFQWCAFADYAKMVEKFLRETQNTDFNE